MDQQKYNMLHELLFSYIKFKNLLPNIRNDIIYKDLEAQGNSDTAKLLRLLEEGLEYQDPGKGTHTDYDILNGLGLDYRQSYNESRGISHKLFDIKLKYKGNDLKLLGGLYYELKPSWYYSRSLKTSEIIYRYAGKAAKELEVYKEKESIILELLEIIDNAMLCLDSRESVLITECYINLDRKTITDLKDVFGIKSRTTLHDIQKSALGKLIDTIDFERVQKLYNLLFKKRVVFENYYDDMNYSNPYEDDVEEDDYSGNDYGDDY